MIVCVCNRVSDRDITRHVHAGMDFSDIQLELGVATQCGQCEGCARELVEQCCREKVATPAVAAPILLRRTPWNHSPALA
jgi:bacterioferritin-associated ferredoxin